MDDFFTPSHNKSSCSPYLRWNLTDLPEKFIWYFFQLTDDKLYIDSLDVLIFFRIGSNSSFFDLIHNGNKNLFN